MHVDRAGLAAVVHAPDLLKELVACERHARVGQKQAQEFKFFIRKRDTRAVDRDRVCVEIDDEPTAAQLMCSFFRLAAAQHRLDAGHELHHAEWLDEVIVRAEVEAADLVVLRALGRSHDDRDGAQLRRRLHALQQLDAVHAGQHHVEHHQIGLLRLERRPE